MRIWPWMWPRVSRLSRSDVHTALSDICHTNHFSSRTDFLFQCVSDPAFWRHSVQMITVPSRAIWSTLSFSTCAWLCRKRKKTTFPAIDCSLFYAIWMWKKKIASKGNYTFLFCQYWNGKSKCSRRVCFLCVLISHHQSHKASECKFLCAVSLPHSEAQKIW